MPEREVTFEVPGERLSAFIATVHRLSPQRVGVCWLTDGSGRARVRVQRPPGVLLGREEFPVVEDSTNTFVPEIDRLSIPSIPGAPTGRPPAHLAIRAKLSRSPLRPEPTLWIIRQDALAQLGSYCRSTHELLLARFLCAVSAAQGSPCVVLRAIAAKGPPPVFVGPAESYAASLKLPNLFVPVGRAIGPALRRDTIRATLAAEPERCVWLRDLDDGAFQAESIAVSAFRPLNELVEYRTKPVRARLTVWSAPTSLSLEPFVEGDSRPKLAVPTRPVETPPAPSDSDRRGLLSRAAGWFNRFKLAPPAEKPKSTPREVERPPERPDRLHHARPESTSSGLERCQELEAKVLQGMQGAEPGSELWSDLAAAYDAIGNHADAAQCWAHALWGVDRPPPLWSWGWLRAECRAARPEVKAIDPVPWLSSTPGPGTTRAMAAWVVWASTQSPVPPLLIEHAGQIQARLEQHEHWLPIRAIWMARVALDRVHQGDVLGLARARDRVSERLSTMGLSLELDVPSFLRFVGEGARDRFTEARRWLSDKRELIHQWINRLGSFAPFPKLPGETAAALRHFGLEPNIAQTKGYVDLLIAWGLTRFAESAAAEQMRKQSAAAFPNDDPVHHVLRSGFTHRIQQVRDGKPPTGPLPDELLREINALDPDRQYAVNKLREASRVLEPTVRVAAYREANTRRTTPTPTSTAASLSTMPIDRLNAEGLGLIGRELQRPGQPDLADVVSAALDRVADWSEENSAAIVAHVPGAIESARNAPTNLAELISTGLTAAATWGRPELALTLVGALQRMASGSSPWLAVEPLITPTARALRRLGLKDEADRLLQQMADRILQGQPVARFRNSKPGEWPISLRVLMHAAGGWYATGRDELAHTVLDEARKDLFSPTMSAADRTSLALAYATTLGHAPVRIALGRLEEMFQRLEGVSVGGATNTYYCLKPLMIVEAAVRAVVSEELTLGPQVRAWLDVDEFAVRRRVRDELKARLSVANL